MDYVKSYTAKYNEPLSSFGGHGWDALQLVVDALSAVGDDKAAIRDYLEKKQGFVGQHWYLQLFAGRSQRADQSGLSMVVVKDNDWALVD